MYIISIFQSFFLPKTIPKKGGTFFKQKQPFSKAQLRFPTIGNHVTVMDLRPKSEAGHRFRPTLGQRPGSEGTRRQGGTGSDVD